MNKSIKTSGQGARYILDDFKIIDLYKSGQTAKQIAALLNISCTTIKRRLRQHGVKRPPKYTLDENSFSVFTPESCYWAGFLAADAWVGSNHKKKKFCINLARKDTAHLHKLCRFIKRQENAVKDKLAVVNNKTYKQCVLEVGNKKIVYDLVKNFNVVQKKSFILHPPTKIPKELLRYFIRGYLDGDGHVGIKDNLIVFNIVSGSVDLLNWLVDCIKNELNINLKLYKKDTVRFIQTSGIKAQSILNWLYKDSTIETRLDRKFEKYTNYCKMRSI